MNTLGESTMTTPVKPPSMLIAEVADQLWDITLGIISSKGGNNDWIPNAIRDEVLPKLELAKRRAVILEEQADPPADDKLPIDEITQAVYERLTTHHMADLKSDIQTIDYEQLALHNCYIELARQIDLKKLCAEFEPDDIARCIDTEALAGEIDPAHVADYVDTSAIAGHIEVGSDEVAQHMDIGAKDIAQHIDLSDLATEIDYEDLASKLRAWVAAALTQEESK